MAVAFDLARVRLIEREAISTAIAEVAGLLQSQLGQQLTAYLSGVKDAKEVGAWARGRVAPRPLAQMRLRCAYQASRMLVEAYGTETARSWFFGTNTRLDDQAPAAVLRHAADPADLRLVLPAARAFVLGAD